MSDPLPESVAGPQKASLPSPRRRVMAALLGGLIATVLYVVLMAVLVVGLYQVMPTERLRLEGDGNLVQTKLDLIQFARELPSRLAWHVWVVVAAGWLGCVVAGVRVAVQRVVR
jgi:hypothetical protein